MNSIYVVDTSAWIILSQNYPRNVFSSLWNNIEDLIKDQKILAPKQVFKEIEQGGVDELTRWSKRYNRMFLENNSAVIKYTQEIVKNHPRLVNPYAYRETADPYIIALARYLKSNLTSSQPIIITDENISRSNGIPFVARSYNLNSLKLSEMFQAEKWEF